MRAGVSMRFEEEARDTERHYEDVVVAALRTKCGVFAPLRMTALVFAPMGRLVAMKILAFF